MSAANVRLRAKAQERIAARRLPSILPSGLSTGYGSASNPCTLCDYLIDRTDVEYEVRTPFHSRLFFHLECYLAWREECVQVFERGTRAAPHD